MPSAFTIDGFHYPIRKDNNSNGGGGIIVCVRNEINAKRRDGLETHYISCIWPVIKPEKGKTFLLGNLYRPQDSKIDTMTDLNVLLIRLRVKEKRLSC